MPEIFALTALFSSGVTFLTTKIGDFATDAASEKTRAFIAETFNKKKTEADLNQNHHLLRAVRKAMLLTTQQMEFAINNTISATRRYTQAEEEHLTATIKRALANELIANEKYIGGEATENAALDQINLLLSGDGHQHGTDAREALAKAATEQWITEVKRMCTIHDFPVEVENLFRNGWQDNGNIWQWFDVVCFTFANLLPREEMKIAQDKFHNRLMAEVATDVQEIKDAVKKLQTFVPDEAYAKKRFDEVTDKLDLILADTTIIIDRQEDQTQLLQKIEGMLQQALSQNAPDNEILQLREERDQLLARLNQSEEARVREETLRKGLEASLAKGAKKEVLKQEALAAVEAKDYDMAEAKLLEAAEARMKQVADDFYQLGNVKELKLEYREALRYYELAAKIPPPNPDYLIEAGILCDTLALFDRALAYYEQAKELYQISYGEGSVQMAGCYNNIGSIQSEKGNLDDALKNYEVSLGIRIAVYGKEHPDVATSYNNIGNVQGAKSDLSDALKSHESALAIRLAVYDEQHPDVAMSYNDIGVVQYSKGNLVDALKNYKAALDIDIVVYGKQHPNVADSYNNIGNVQDEKGDWDDALKSHEAALNIRTAVFGKQHPKVAMSYNNIGVVQYKKGDLEDALKNYETAKEIFIIVYGKRHPRVASVYLNVANLKWGQGQLTEALPYAQKSFDIFLSMLGAEHPYTIQAKALLDDITNELG